MKIVEMSAALEALSLPAVSLGLGGPLGIIERAGRTCYKSEPKGDPAFVKMILKRGHESVLEHASATFRIVCDRGISHEIVRHRLASYSQESTRYCNYSQERFGKEITVIKPPMELGCPEFAPWLAAVQQAEDSYFAMLDAGCKPEIARSVLPTCLKTEIVMTANFREWRHFLKLRTAPAAHPQMQVVAKLIQAELMKVAASVFEDIGGAP